MRRAVRPAFPRLHARMRQACPVQQQEAAIAVPQQASPAGRVARIAADATKLSAPLSGFQPLMNERLAALISTEMSVNPAARSAASTSPTAGAPAMQPA